MIQGFVTYDLAVSLYERCESIKARHHLRDQLLRASLSVLLNVAEGSGEPTPAERRRFYGIALGSIRETQALLTVLKESSLISDADRLGGLLWRLVHPRPS